MNRMDKKVAVITGGASGIGKASAIRLAQEGAMLLLLIEMQKEAKLS
ncbi:SDR family NAD(P)-dependent oxidoreductase [Niallia taxi]